jgi:hypothetical protein
LYRSSRQGGGLRIELGEERETFGLKIEGREREEEKRRHVQTKAGPIAPPSADMNRKTDMTSDRIFFGAFVNAYSNPVIEAKISLRAIKTYLRLSKGKDQRSFYFKNKG